MVADRAHLRIAGIPIRFDPTFFFIVALLGLTARPEPAFVAAWVAVVLVSILLHEMGHALTFRAFGYRPQIVLHGMGGATSTRSPEPIPPGRSLLITLAGPGSGLALGGLVLAFVVAIRPVHGELARTVLSDLLWVNIGWSLLNLIPLLPLDGGRVLVSVLDIVTKGRGERPTRYVGIVVAVAAAVWAFSVGLVFAAVLALFFLFENAQALAGERLPPGDRTLMPRIDEAGRALAAGDADGSASTALEALARARSRRARGEAAQVAVRAMRAQLDGGRFEAAATTGEAIFKRIPDPFLAYDIARTWTRAGRRDQGAVWLGEAVRAGYDDLESLRTDPDLATLRGTPVYEDAVRRLS